MRKAKTIWINNATTDFVEKVHDTFSEDTEVRVLLFSRDKGKPLTRMCNSRRLT